MIAKSVMLKHSEGCDGEHD